MWLWLHGTYRLNSCSLLLLLKFNIMYECLYIHTIVRHTGLKWMLVAKKNYNLPYKYQTKSCTTHKTTLFFLFFHLLSCCSRNNLKICIKKYHFIYKLNYYKLISVLYLDTGHSISLARGTFRRMKLMQISCTKKGRSEIVILFITLYIVIVKAIKKLFLLPHFNACFDVNLYFFLCIKK